MKSWFILVIITIIDVFQSTSVSGQIHLTGNSRLKIDSSTCIKSNGPLILSQESVLDLKGTLIVTKDIENRRPFSGFLGTGTIILSGRSNQSVSGNNVIQNLTVDNDSGITVRGVISVTKTLKMENGFIDLSRGRLHLTDSATLSGNPSGIDVMPGSGYIKTEFPGERNYPPIFFIHPGSDSVSHWISDGGISCFGIFGDTLKNALTIGTGSHPPFESEPIGINRLLLGIGNSKLKESSFEAPGCVIFPNPTHDFFTLKMDHDFSDGNVLVNIFNSQGELIRKHNMGLQPSYRFSLIGDPPGVYLVQVTVGRRMMFEKIVKN